MGADGTDRATGAFVMRPLRFAIVTTNYPPYAQGEEGLSIQWLARALALRGHVVEVVHDTDTYRARTGQLPGTPERDHGIRVHRLRGGRAQPFGAFRARLSGQPPAYADRLKEILSGRFDVIHFHDIAPIGGSALWSIGAGVKLQSADDYWMVCPKGDLNRRGAQACKAPTCARCLLEHGQLPRSRPVDEFGPAMRSTGIDAFLVQSRATRARHHSAGFGLAMNVVPPFLPGSAPVLKTAEAPFQDRPFFLYDGALTSAAALPETIGQFSEDIDADFLILGSGPETSTIRRIARQRSNVRYLGPRAPVARQTLVREALALVLPKDDGARVPLGALAASREGTPLIATGTGSGAEFVRETGGGYVYDTPPELRAIYYRLAHDPRHAAELGRRAFSGHARHWREDVSIDAYFDVIRDVAIRRGLTGLLSKLEPEVARHA